MQGFMLTEDIDSSIRTIREGHKIKSDPQIISRELAPTTFSALWIQRMRWAQGWYQVSLRHTLPGIVSGKLNTRQKLGLFQLLIWREIYPWISMQIIPIVAFWLWSAGADDLRVVNWFIPIFVVTSLVTLGTGPGQIFYIVRVGHPSIIKHTRWIVFYLIAGFFYTEYKNLIGRVAQIKEIMGERKWHTTPRS
jgi:cellulose synthase/poly-beta-1,6-N-acetylglucosamine synthase-like glycosyltransferase